MLQCPSATNSHSRKQPDSGLSAWYGSDAERESWLCGKSIYDLVKPIGAQGEGLLGGLDSSIRLVEILQTPASDNTLVPRRWAYACVHRFGTQSAEYDVWFLEDVTRVSSVFASGLSSLSPLRGPRVDRRRKGIDVEAHPRYLNTDSLTKDEDDDESTWTSTITSLVPGLSHVMSRKRSRAKTEPVLRRREESAIFHTSTSSPVSPTPLYSLPPEGRTGFILGIAERQAVAIASLFGLGKIPKWIFARIRHVFVPPPTFSSTGPESSQKASSSPLSGGQPTIALQVNAFGRIHQAYPIAKFLGMSTEHVMNRFIMRFV
ncbi:hypothetical protein HDU67_002233, partial [Dinochytrium kinnereticum]